MTGSSASTSETVLSKIPVWVYVIAVPMLAAVTVGLRGFGTGDASAAQRTTPGVAIDIADFAFAPKSITVSVGETITVSNHDGATHTVTSTDDAFDTGDLAGGAHAEITVDRPGTYPYFCDIHQYMKGTVRVV